MPPSIPVRVALDAADWFPMVVVARFVVGGCPVDGRSTTSLVIAKSSPIESLTVRPVKRR